LAGLTTSEMEAVVNFAVPTDGSSPVAPFATVSGRVLAADGVTPVPFAIVLVDGSAPVFRPTITTRADAAGQYMVSTLDEGPFSLRAQDSATGLVSDTVSLSVGPGQVSLIRDVVFANAGAIVGTVRFATGLPVGSGQVTVSGGPLAAPVVVPVIGGAYTMGGLQTGTYTVEASASGRTLTLTGIAVSVGATTTADITLKALATLRIVVTQAGDVPLPGAYAYFKKGLQYIYIDATDAFGVALATDVGEGPYALEVYASDNSTLLGARSGVIAPADDGRVIDVLITSNRGTVRGTVFAGDGSTPLPTAFVEVIDLSTNTRAASRFTSDTGAYEFASLLLSGSFKVIAHGPGSASGITAEATTSFATGPAVINLTLPVAAVHGTVVYADGTTPTGNASITLAQEDANGNITNAYATTGRFDGSYTVVANPGPFEILVLDQYRMLGGRAAGTVSGFTSSPVVNIVMPPSGTVTGFVRDASGGSLPFAEAHLASNGAEIFNDGFSGHGSFGFARVPLGRFSLEACDFTTSYYCGTATGQLTTEGQTLDLNITVAGNGSVSGTVFAANGTTPVSNAYVIAVAGPDGPGGVLSRSTLTDGAGRYSFAGLTAGPITVVTLAPVTFLAVGVNRAILNAGASLTLDVTQGTAVPACPQPLQGADGFKYDVSCSGQLSTGGTADGHLTNAYQGAYYLRINGSTPSSQGAAQLEAGGRQLAYGPIPISGVSATRKVFVPSAGGFARYLDTVTNPTNAPVTLDVQIESRFGGAVHLVVDPVATGNTYAVTLADASLQALSTIVRPALAHVFGGAGATVPVSGVTFQQLLGTSAYRWTVTIPAAGSVTLMHFVVQRDATTPMAADAQAQALANLTDPNALAGMTTEEKALVVNFKIQ
jgi:hypothetical protein